MRDGPYVRFIFPVGDVVFTTHGYSMRVWTCPADKLEYVRAQCADWEGFTLHEGTPISEDNATSPQGWLCPSSRMAVSLPGDVPIHMDISDPAQALRVMETRTDLPVALEVDAWRYTDDDLYRRAVDTAADYFIYYFRTGHPKPLQHTLSMIDILLADC